MVAIKTTATVDRSRTLAVLLPECGVEAGEYEVLVVLNGEAPAVSTGDASLEAARQQRLRETMQRIRARNPFRDIEDPVAWQRAMREDVTLPDRK